MAPGDEQASQPCLHSQGRWDPGRGLRGQGDALESPAALPNCSAKGPVKWPKASEAAPPENLEPWNCQGTPFSTSRGTQSLGPQEALEELHPHPTSLSLHLLLRLSLYRREQPQGGVERLWVAVRPTAPSYLGSYLTRWSPYAFFCKMKTLKFRLQSPFQLQGLLFCSLFKEA